IQSNLTTKVLGFRKEDQRVNVYYAACLAHPTRGRTQLIRKHQSMQQLEDIFIKPRTHTGVGYYSNQHQQQ
ncbi:hypothetical protein JKP88DRAFT_142729, partial [Tribonema minus]